MYYIKQCTLLVCSDGDHPSSEVRTSLNCASINLSTHKST